MSETGRKVEKKKKESMITANAEKQQRKKHLEKSVAKKAKKRGRNRAAN